MALNRLLRRVGHRLPARRIVGPRGEPYLVRYFVFRLGRYTCFLHRFVDSDPDRGLHDHPWDSTSLLLSGRYREFRLTSTPGEVPQRVLSRVMGPGRINRIQRNCFHRIVLLSDEVYTLFFHGARVKEWGFLSNGEFSTEGIKREKQWWKNAPKGSEIEAQISLGSG